MSHSPLRKVIVVRDESETFTKSVCNCGFCVGMHNSVAEWSTFIPETNLQKRMIETVAKIENRARLNDETPPLRRSPRLVGLTGILPLV